MSVVQMFQWMVFFQMKEEIGGGETKLLPCKLVKANEFR